MTENITKTTINRLRRSAVRGQTEEVRDLTTPGLSIRVTGRSVKWYCRWSNNSDGGKSVRSAHPICSIDVCDDPDEMRKIARIGKNAVKQGESPVNAIAAALARLLGTSSADGGKSHTWDFKSFREEFKKNPPAHLRKETVDGYYRAISLKEVGDAVYTKRLAEITPQDIQSLRARIFARGKDRQAELTMQALRTSFEWAEDPTRSGSSGIDEESNPMLLVRTRRKRGARKPTEEDALAAAQLIRVEDECTLVIEDPNLPSMLDVGKLLTFLMDPTNCSLERRTACLLLVYSVQRRATVVSAISKSMMSLPGQPFAFWVLHGGTMKSGRQRLHVLPFSKNVWDLIEAWKETQPECNDWLFPGIPTHRKPQAEGHVHPRTLTQWFYDAWEQAGCSRRYNAHVIRMVFGTYLSKRDISKESRKLILDHAEGRGSDVTEVHYNFDPRLPDKEIVMTAWTQFLDDCVALALKSRGIPSEQAFVQEGAVPVTSPIGVQVEIKVQAEDNGQPLRVGSLDARKSDLPGNGSRVAELSRLERLRANLAARINLDKALEETRRKVGGSAKE